MALSAKTIALIYNLLLDRDLTREELVLSLELAKTYRMFNPYELAAMIVKGDEFASKHNLNTAQTRPSSSTVKYRNLSFELPTADFTFENLSKLATYEPYVVDHLLDNLADVTSFVDVGANLGLIALPVAASLASSGHVFAFEAASTNADLLLANARANGIANMTIVPVALSDANGSAFFNAGNSTSNKALGIAASFERTSVVPTVRLDDFWDPERPIDMMKVDIEGFEYRFVVGARETIQRNRPKIYMEYADSFQRSGSGVPGVVLLEAVLEFGYAATILHRTRATERVGRQTEGAIPRIEDALAHHIDREKGSHLDLYFELEGG